MMNHYAMEMIIKNQQIEIERQSRQAWKWMELKGLGQRKQKPLITVPSVTLPNPARDSACCAACC